MGRGEAGPFEALAQVAGSAAFGIARSVQALAEPVPRLRPQSPARRCALHAVAGYVGVLTSWQDAPAEGEAQVAIGAPAWCLPITAFGSSDGDLHMLQLTRVSEGRQNRRAFGRC